MNDDLPSDFQTCGECGFDHQYEYVEAFNWHQQEGARRNIAGSKSGWALTADEVETLSKAKGGLQWAAERAIILASRGGDLPPNWKSEIIDSGLIANQIQTWTGPCNTYTVLEWSKEADSL